ncbi:MAG: 3'-5' exonuclease, partial [Verrucomicrobiota bacterium]
CLRAVIWHHLERALENTQGVFRILQAYHDNYDRIVRRPGRLAFTDLAHLLAPESTGSPMGAGDAFTKQLIDFRLDGQYDHWLFDEFQDTSRPQWDVVSNLVDEIVQDTSGQRSLFYVGDTKQCLYLWRNSDDRLFHEIQGQYPSIEPTQLATSWRSAPAILEAVNTVFSDYALIAECFSDDAAARWDRAWQRHEASKATKELSGYACWQEARKEAGPTRNERILETLEKLKPIERGMSVGILVRKNEDATNVADYIRENSNYPVHTGSALRPAIDNAAGVALLALIRLAAHPGDLHAQGFLSLIDHSSNGASLIKTARALRKRLYLDSYATAVAWAAEQIAGHLSTDDIRHRERLDLLVEKAHSFDNEGRRDLDALYHYLETSSSGECETEEAIIVETIHKSKGLEYDVVILVCEDKTVQSERRISPLLDERGKAEWVMEPIKKELMQADPELGRLYQQNRSQQGFGNLCILYVGMTRAKRALYMISDLERVSKGSTVHFLRERFGKEADENGILWETGNPDWSESFETALDRSDQTLRLKEETITSFKPAHPRLQLAKPSQNKMDEDGIAQLFNLEDRASEFGTSVHAVFEKIEWLEDDNLSSLLSNLDQDSVAATIQKVFENEDIRRVFTKPRGPAIVWRERSFSYIDGNQLINGVFDRVNLHQDETGKIISAEIIDFKTDRIEYPNTIDKAIEYHRSQLETYRKALSRILNLEQSLIQVSIVFTAISERHLL